MRAERFLDDTHTSASMTMEATGVALTILTSGSISMRNQTKDDESHAAARATASDSMNPIRILESVKAADIQNWDSCTSETSLSATLKGEGRKRSSPIMMEAIHQIAIQNTIAAALYFLLDKVEIIKRGLASYCLRILGLKDREIE